MAQNWQFSMPPWRCAVIGDQVAPWRANRGVLAEGSDESSNLETLPDSSSNPDLDDLFDTLADWNHQLKSAKIDLKGPQP